MPMAARALLISPIEQILILVKCVGLHLASTDRLSLYPTLTL